MTQRGDITRERLLEAAHELLVERRAVEPAVSEICARAGVNVALVSYHFGGKTQLLDALLERAVAGVVGQLDRLSAQQLDPRERLRRHVEGVIANYARYPYAVALGERLGDTDGQLGRQFAQPLLAFHAQLLRDGASSGDFRDGVDPTFFFASLVGMCEFLFSARTWVEGATGAKVDDATLRRFTEHSAALLLDGLGREAGAPTLQG